MGKGGASPVAQWKRIRLPMQEMQETWVRSLGQEEPLEKVMAIHSSILPGKFCGQRSRHGHTGSDTAHGKGEEQGPGVNVCSACLRDGKVAPLAGAQWRNDQTPTSNRRIYF